MVVKQLKIPVGELGSLRNDAMNRAETDKTGILFSRSGKFSDGTDFSARIVGVAGHCYVEVVVGDMKFGPVARDFFGEYFFDDGPGETYWLIIEKAL